MFSIYAGNVRSVYLVVGVVSSYSTHTGLQHWNFGYRNCSVSVEQSVTWQTLYPHGGHMSTIDQA